MTRIRIPVLAATLFLSAFLLFVCQPMVGKMILPYLGGAAAVWTTCVVFFQVMLLAGYVYAHLVGRVYDIRKQILTHGLVLLLPFAFLPVGFAGASSRSFSEHPSLTLLLQLFVSAGVPFFVVSATAPLLQNWLSRTEDKAAADPYFLYSASNAGSLLALIAYPFLLEPRIGVASQSRVWLFGYAGLFLMIAAVSALVWRPARQTSPQAEEESQDRPDAKTRFYWIAAAFVPSGLMLAVTNHIAANLASAPFLWIVPLAIYLLTFTLAFAPRLGVTSVRVSKTIPMVLLAIFPLVAASVVAPPGLNWLVIGLHLVLLYCGALLCHTGLAERRPDSQHLTEFYFWIALGGVLGGIFTAMVAPAVFNTILEYPLLVVLLPFFRSGKTEGRDLVIPGLFGLAVLVTWLVFRTAGLDSDTEWLALAHTAFIFACYKWKNHVRRFALSFAMLLLVYAAVLPGYIDSGNRLYAERNFFGVKKVFDDPDARLRKLLNGDTIHGIESTDAARSGQPLSYYYSSGPVGEVIDVMRGRGKPQQFGVIGLGSGTMAAYADANHHITFYEIDPAIDSIARRYFTFLPRCGTACGVVAGDGRLQLAMASNGAFDLLMLDAFSSDSIPTHLLSREALQLYLSKLAPDGILLFHVSNRYLNVERLVSALVADAELAAFSRSEDAGDLRKEGKTNSNHVVAARRLEDLASIATHPRWKRVLRPPQFKPWTDDYSNLLSLIRWF